MANIASYFESAGCVVPTIYGEGWAPTIDAHGYVWMESHDRIKRCHTSPGSFWEDIECIPPRGYRIRCMNEQGSVVCITRSGMMYVVDTASCMAISTRSLVELDVAGVAVTRDNKVYVAFVSGDVAIYDELGRGEWTGIELYKHEDPHARLGGFVCVDTDDGTDICFFWKGDRHVSIFRGGAMHEHTPLLHPSPIARIIHMTRDIIVTACVGIAITTRIGHVDALRCHRFSSITNLDAECRVLTRVSDTVFCLVSAHDSLVLTCNILSGATCVLSNTHHAARHVAVSPDGCMLAILQGQAMTIRTKTHSPSLFAVHVCKYYTAYSDGMLVDMVRLRVVLQMNSSTRVAVSRDGPCDECAIRVRYPEPVPRALELGLEKALQAIVRDLGLPQEQRATNKAILLGRDMFVMLQMFVVLCPGLRVPRSALATIGRYINEMKIEPELE
jgi:hypothetical protein